jgi:Zn-dependent peptidase ImmA (M78 family)
MAYGAWRDWLSSQGIYVFEFNIPIEDARGFCLIKSDPKVIVVSKKDSIRGRIFSLFHEYAHILLRESVICNMESDTSPDSNVANIENWCNRFAGAFLLQKKGISEDYQKFKTENGNFRKFLQDTSNKYKISQECALVRLRFLDLIEYPYYLAIKTSIKSEVQEKKLKDIKEREELKSKGVEPSFQPQLPKDKTIWTERGANFVSLVIQNSNRGFITERDVMDILDLRIDHLVKLLPQ